MYKAYDPQLNMVRDVRYDVSSLATASNIYDFCANLIGSKVKMPFARQLWMLVHVFGEFCPRCTPENMMHLECVDVDADPHDVATMFTMLEYGICPKCHANKHQLIYSGELKDVNEFVLVGGQRMGKSTLVAIASAYVIHKYAKSPKLSSVARGIQDFSPLTGTFIALTTTNAIKLLWKPFREIIVASEWFEEYFSLLKKYGQDAGRELYQFNPTGNYLRIFTQNLDFYPEGPNKRTLRGPTRCMSAVDELGWFPYDPNVTEDSNDEDDTRERANAEEVHTVLTNSLSTVRTEVYNLYAKGIYAYPQGMNLATSSPASWQDKIMRLYRDAESSTTTFAVKAATWEVSPIYTRDHPIIANLYRTNMRKAERDFGANPPKLDSSVFAKSQIQSMFSIEQTHVVVYDNTEEFTRGKAQAIRHPARVPASVLALDAGLKNNAFAASVQYKDYSDKMVKVPLALEIVAKPKSRIDFVYAYQNFIKPIIKEHNVKELYADRWNSEYILRLAEEEHPGLICKNYSLRPKDFEEFINFVATGQLLLPRSEIEFDEAEGIFDFKRDLLKYPGAHLYRQFLTVQQVAGVLVKGNGSTDDMFRALVLGVTRLFDPKVVERMEVYKSKERDSLAAPSVAAFGGRTLAVGGTQAARNMLLYGRTGYGQSTPDDTKG